MSDVIPERAALFNRVTITHGPGPDPDGEAPTKACAMTLAGWGRGLDWRDHHPCFDQRLTDLVIQVNDSLPVGPGLDAWAREVALLMPDGPQGALLDRLTVERLRDVLTLAPSWPDVVREQVVAAVEGVIDAIENDGDREAARSAAWSAAGSAWSAARSARSAGSAAWSAAEWSARSAAWSAAWQREADRILAALREGGS